MKFDKTKVMRSAERFLTQGKYLDAVQEYAKIVEHDPKDYTTLNILGDLYIKTDSQDKAISCYSRVADHYSKQGFAQKAIAVYKKVLKLEPNSIEISLKLAPLYQLKGSVLEAKEHYTIIANHYQETGKKVDALNIWKRIAELDPTNNEIYLKLAEGYLEENQREEAGNAFVEAGLRSQKSGNYENAATAFLGALEIKPNDFTALKGYVNAQLKVGNAEEAVEWLQKIRKENIYNTELLLLLTDCYLEIDNPYEAEKTVITIVEKEPIFFTRFIEVVHLYLQKNDLDSSVRVLTMASEHLLVGGKAEEFKVLVDEILTRNPELIQALRLLIRYYEWLNDNHELKLSLERLAEASNHAKSEEDEKYALRFLRKLAPHETKHLERLVELGDDEAALQEVSFNTSYEPEIVGNEDVPRFENFETYSEKTDSENTDLQNANDSSTDFAFSSTVDKSVSDDKTNIVTNSEAEVSKSGLSPQLEMHLHQELESVDFYISNEYSELATETLRVLEEQFGNHHEIEARKIKLGIVEAKPQEEELEKPNEPQNEQENVELKSEEIVETSIEFSHNDEFVSVENVGIGLSEDENIDVEDFIEETKFEAESSQFSDFRDGLDLEESESNANDEDFETHYQTATAYKEMGLMDQAISEFQESIKHVGKAEEIRRLFQCYTMLGLCFTENQMPKQAVKWYEKCLNLVGLNDEEKTAVRYEIAVAHQADGNKDVAMQHFEEIYGVDVNYRDVSSRLYSLR